MLTRGQLSAADPTARGQLIWARGWLAWVVTPAEPNGQWLGMGMQGSHTEGTKTSNCLSRLL